MAKFLDENEHKDHDMDTYRNLKNSGYKTWPGTLAVAVQMQRAFEFAFPEDKELAALFFKRSSQLLHQ